MSDIGRIPIGRILHLTDDERFWMVVAKSPRVDNTVLSCLAPHLQSLLRMSRRSTSGSMLSRRGIPSSFSVACRVRFPVMSMSAVVGFMAGLTESGGCYEQAFRMGVCTGSASAFSMELATRSAVEELLEHML